jgi:predicted nucleic acid-binding protein
MYINLAIVTNAAYLVSRDKDLLDLMTTSTERARQFRSRYPFLRIITPAGFITATESASAAPAMMTTSN